MWVAFFGYCKTGVQLDIAKKTGRRLGMRQTCTFFFTWWPQGFIYSNFLYSRVH
ncbi:hypothetical protein HanPSC8_Chr04g0143841 [Helianthus annuus]|nr:hypothetical protein HanPSC8_Chr04g0143841 [Helianthus annuus]